MSLPASNRLLNRRQFVQSGVATLGLTAWFSRVATPAAGAGAASNPYAYDLDRLRKTDANLIQYEEDRRIGGLRDETRRIAIGPDGQLFVAAGKYITMYEVGGPRRNEIELRGPVRCLAVAPDGFIYAGLRDHIEVFDPKGKPQTAWTALGRRAWLTGLAVSETDLFAADAGGRLVWRYDRSGKLVGRIGERDRARNRPGFIVPSPFFDVKLHRDGLLRVTNPGRHRVEAYTFEGDLELAWGKPSFGIEGFAGCCNPVALAVLADGRIVTCEKGLPRVKVYTVEGTLDSVVAGAESFGENAKVCGSDDCANGGLDAAVDSKGRIYILDLVANDLRIMARKGDASAVSPGRRESKS